MARPVTLTVGDQQIRLRLNDRIDLYKDAWECKRHSNADFELHMILKGSCALEIGDRQYDLAERSAVIVPPGQYHLPKPLPGEFERFTMSFSLGRSGLRSALEEVKPFAVTDSMVQLCQRIFRECGDNAPFRGELLQALVTQLLLEVLRCLGLGKRSQEAPAEVNESIQRIDDFFELHMADDMGAEELAESLHISRRQLARILQKTYGMGFREKRVRTRMDHAAWLLRNTADPIQRVAAAVGYASETAFYQTFVRQFGQTPGQYRAEANQKKTQQ